MNKKIYINLIDLKKKITSEKNKGKKIVHCHGVFDILHIGHIKHFKSAKSHGDFLIVSITSDQYVKKGPGRPRFSHNLRAEVIASLENVDAVFINNYQTPINLIKSIKPNIYFKGPDYKILKNDKTKNIIKEVKAIKSVGGKILFSNDEVFSSSNIINRNFSLFNDTQKQFLKGIVNKYNYNFIVSQVEKIKKLNVFLIGEIIIDQYIFGEVLGKSGKESHLVMQEAKKEQYLGGAAAIANHLSTFCNKISFYSFLGKDNSFLKFIKNSLFKKIYTRFIINKDSSTIVKTRFVDNINNTKLFGVYKIDNKKLNNIFEKKFENLIKKNLKKNDLLLISDYGHGLISSSTAKMLVAKNKNICLNAQVNASNLGYHSLRKYKKINTLIINENELRHEMRDKIGDYKILTYKLARKYDIKNLVVTRGKNGATLLKNHTKLIESPAFANKVVDKVGAGDAMLAVISLCLKVKMPDDLVLFLGSLAGSTAIEHIGNSKFINKDELLRQVEYLIK